MLPARLGAQQGNTKKEWLSNSQVLEIHEIYSHKQNAYTIDPLSRRLLGIRKTVDKKVNGNMVGIREDTKENEEKAKVIPRAWRDKSRLTIPGPAWSPV